MKRIKGMNGYTIYQAVTKRDEEEYCTTIGNYAIWRSSEIRDFGLSRFGCAYDDVETWERVIDICNDPDELAYWREQEGY